MNQVDVFGNEPSKIISWGGDKFKCLIHKQVEVPYYFISQDGRVLCMRPKTKPRIRWWRGSF